MKKLFWGGLFFLVTITTNGQIARESEILKRMDKGKELMDAGEYEKAQAAFLFVLENKKKLPSEMAYYFGAKFFSPGEV